MSNEHALQALVNLDFMLLHIIQREAAANPGALSDETMRRIREQISRLGKYAT